MSTLEASTVLHSHSSPTSVLASILHLTIASLPSSPSTAAPVPSSSNHQPPATATTPPPFSLSLARALDFSLSNTHRYLLEQSLSVDNLFVFVMIFKYFKVPIMYQVLYNCFLDCLVALPIAARQQIAVVSLFFEVLDSFFDYSLAKSDYA
ncbi:unnamed protein product [Prunus armeniaca]|uniref:Uncharacterized protein n=1 Tax=Prunus armeniaca TaxID=36596 RepID=A0A6J5TRU9_PRUAR|nr:unnamed protein product [Prunus armeniaca]